MGCSVNYEYEKKYQELLKNIVLKTFSDTDIVYIFWRKNGN